MREFKFIPKAKASDSGEMIPSPFTGHITFKILKYTDRLKMLQNLNYGVGEDGKIEAKDKGLDMAIKFVDIALENITQVAIERVSDGFKFNSAEDLEYDQQASSLLSDVGSLIVSGVELGKN